MLIGLTIVTLLAVAIAVVATVAAWRVTAAEQARSRARVAALADDIRAGLADAADLPASPIAWQSASGVLSGAGGPRAGFRASMAAVAGAVIVVAIAATVLTWGARSRRSTASPAVHAAPAGNMAAAPLELIELEYDRGPSDLVIRGVVRIPPGGARTLADLAADVVVVDGAGGLISTNRAPVDKAMITPGAEVTFSVRVDGSPQVARYRISFRAGGVVIPHVDRRGVERIDAPAARHISTR